MKLPLYNTANEEIGEVTLPEDVFGVPWNAALVKQVTTAFQANQRHPWASVKERGEVKGGGKKPWRQKGTGRARHGSIRSPLWKGGGVTFGPQKEKIYAQKVNKKMRRGALLSALSKKIADKEVKIVDVFAMQSDKTKHAAEILAHLCGIKKNQKKSRPRTLMVPGKGERGITRAGRNIEKNRVLPPNALNAYECLTARFIFFEKKALDEFINEHRK